MSNEPPRIDRVTTGTGDDGTTGLADGERYKKDDPRLDLLGALDEANSILGWALVAIDRDHAVAVTLSQCQSVIFDIGAMVATGQTLPSFTAPLEQAVARLDNESEQLNAALAPLEEFLLPGGNEASARLHVARTIVRRTERDFWRFVDAIEGLRRTPAGVFLNRLSDYLFIAARTQARSMNRSGRAPCRKNPPIKDSDAESRREAPPGR